MRDTKPRVRDAWIERLLEPPADGPWCLLVPQDADVHEQDIETRLAIGNGAFGMRAARQPPLPSSRPATLVAGVFVLGDVEPRVPSLVVFPDWLRVDVLVDGEPLRPDAGETLRFWRALDLRRGLLLSEWRQRTPRGRVVRVRRLRIAALHRRELALEVVRVAVEQTAIITLETDLQPPVRLEPAAANPDVLLWRVPAGSTQLALATASHARDGFRRVPRPQGEAAPTAPTGELPEPEVWSGPVLRDEPATLVRLAAIVRGDTSVGDAADRALDSLRVAEQQGPARTLSSHIRAWEERWVASDVEVDGDPVAQQALRFAVYHLVSAANPHDEHVSIGARGLTGSGYLGHVFWDTEIFLLPFFTLTWPAAARALLLYRWHTLPAARAKAARLGYRGALYAWESALDGEEVTPPWAVGLDGHAIPILCGTQEHHISADVAYAVWQYWQATRDVAFLLNAGAEILLETARFWASRAHLEADGRSHIRGVIGPDEYHESVDDDAYTNGLAAWNLRRGAEVAALLQARWPARWTELSSQLELSQAELRTWPTIADSIVTGAEAQTGRIEQFAGYFGLEDIDLRPYASRRVPIDVVLGAERTRHSQVIKQPDVIMLLALLPEQYDTGIQQVNFDYYEPRCGHGSSLSPATHALQAARLGRTQLAQRYFRQAAAIDLDATHGETALGVHIAALGGVWQAAVFGFGGLQASEHGLRLDPHLPADWQRLGFRIHWRGRQLHVELRREPDQASVALERGRPLTISVRGHPRRVERGQPVIWNGA